MSDESTIKKHKWICSDPSNKGFLYCQYCNQTLLSPLDEFKLQPCLERFNHEKFKSWLIENGWNPKFNNNRQKLHTHISGKSEITYTLISQFKAEMKKLSKLKY